MSNAMAAYEPINYLDSILNEEEKRCEYGHQWRNFTISRSGRFKSKNRKRDIVDGKLFDTTATAATTTTTTTIQATNNKDDACRYNNNSNCNVSNTAAYTNKEQDKHLTRSPFNATSAQSKSFQQQPNKAGIRDKTETYKSYYETNL